MEKMVLDYPGKTSGLGFSQVGVISSGDMEVIFIPEPSDSLEISIVTTIDNSKQRWERIFKKIHDQSGLPSGKIIIHDYGASTSVARTNIEQILEGAENG